MSWWSAAARIGCVLVGMGLVAGCPAQESLRCQTNAECGLFRTCDVAKGTCLCTDNRACGKGEFCNASGLCQVIAGCSDNSDCEAQNTSVALICDTKRGQCASSDQCFDDAHCPLGHICDSFSTACVPGCRDEADCPLGQGCLRASSGDVLGRCQEGSCSRDDQCEVGYNCDLTTNTCVFDDRGPFCGACQRFDPVNPQCGDPANYCLVDTGDPARRSHYCGVDCSQEQGCPNGYDCLPVIIFGPPATPSCIFDDCVDGRCTNSGTTCGTRRDCPNGLPGGDCYRARVGICAGTTSTECTSDAECGGSEGSCRFAECRVRERAAYGVCSCVVDADCPADDCRGADLSDPDNPVVGHCLLSGHRCYEAGDCDVIACINGGCRIGSNCKPGAERRCADLQPVPGGQ